MYEVRTCSAACACEPYLHTETRTFESYFLTKKTKKQKRGEKIPIRGGRKCQKKKGSSIPLKPSDVRNRGGRWGEQTKKSGRGENYGQTRNEEGTKNNKKGKFLCAPSKLHVRELRVSSETFEFTTHHVFNFLSPFWRAKFLAEKNRQSDTQITAITTMSRG